MGIADVDDVHPAAGEVAVEPAFVGLCGTDLHVFLGEFEERVPYPAILGHEVSGWIAEVGEGVDAFEVGDGVVVDPVFPCGECALCRAGRFNNCVRLDVLGLDCAGALAERFVVDATNVYDLPEDVDTKHAVMAELYAVGVHSARLTGIDAGDVVVIIGAGRLGLSLLDVMRRSGAAQVAVVDVLEGRLALADTLGADRTINSRHTDPVAEILELTDGVGADKVVEAVGRCAEVAGREPPMGMACAMIRPGGQITAMGQGEGTQPFDWRRLVLKEGRIVTSRLNLGELGRAVSLLASGALHPEHIITDTVGPDDVQDGFEMMHDNPDRVVKVVVDMTDFAGGQRFRKGVSGFVAKARSGRGFRRCEGEGADSHSN